MSSNLKITTTLPAKLLEDTEALREAFNTILEDVDGEVVTAKMTETSEDFQNNTFTLELDIAQEEKEDSE